MQSLQTQTNTIDIDVPFHRCKMAVETKIAIRSECRVQWLDWKRQKAFLTILDDFLPSHPILVNFKVGICS